MKLTPSSPFHSKNFFKFAAVRTFLFVLFACLLVVQAKPDPVSANSAPYYWTGGEGTGISDFPGSVPVKVDQEELIFTIEDLPESCYKEEQPFLNLSSSVKASYTINNPQTYDVTIQLAFPMGVYPSYGYRIYQQDSGNVSADDTSKAHVYVNDQPIDSKVRYTLYSIGTPMDPLAAENDASLALSGLDLWGTDGRLIPIETWFPGLQVTECIWNTKDDAEITLYDQPGICYFIPDFVNEQVQEDGSITLFAAPGQKGYAAVYALGDVLRQMPEASFASRDSSRKAAPDKTNSMDLEQLSEKMMPAFLHLSKEDAYNIFFQFLNAQDSKEQVIGGWQEVKDRMPRNLMRWLTYELDIQPDQTITNTVESVFCPDMDASTEEPVYTYTYLLSPAKSWSAFKDLNIQVNTPCHLLNSVWMDGSQWKPAIPYRWKNSPIKN